MDRTNKTLSLIGRVLICIVAVVLILAGSLKLIGVGAEEMLEGLQKARLDGYRVPISLLSICCGLLLLIRPVWKWGLLMSSSYWGGAIVAHLTYDDSFLMPAMFLGTLWLGALLFYCHDARGRKRRADDRSQIREMPTGISSNPEVSSE